MVFSIDKGLERVRTLAREKDVSPCIVAVYALGPNHGKSYFINQAVNVLGKDGAFVVSTNDYDSPQGYQWFDHPMVKYYFLHIGTPGFYKDLVERDVLDAVGRKVDLHVGIHNPFMSGKDLQVFSGIDLLVENPNSVVKKLF